MSSTERRRPLHVYGTGHTVVTYYSFSVDRKIRSISEQVCGDGVSVWPEGTVESGREDRRAVESVSTGGKVREDHLSGIEQMEVGWLNGQTRVGQLECSVIVAASLGDNPRKVVKGPEVIRVLLERLSIDLFGQFSPAGVIGC